MVHCQACKTVDAQAKTIIHCVVQSCCNYNYGLHLMGQITLPTEQTECLMNLSC